MLLSLGHGQKVLKLQTAMFAGAAGAAFRLSPDQEPIEAVTTASAGAGIGRFGYLFSLAAGPSHAIASDVLDKLGDAMIEQAARPDVRAIAPIITYFGQFIDHDITANTDRDIPGSGNLLTIDQPQLKPLPRDFVVSAVTNLRDATLRMDSLYGDGPNPTGVESAMRDGAKMRIGQVSPSPPFHVQPAPPSGDDADLPRVGPLVQAGVLNAADVPSGLLTGGTAAESRAALIGDGRNEENLVVAQLHLAFLRFHNAVLKAQGDGTGAADFEAARRYVRKTYQWLVINEYLPAVADEDTLAAVLNDEAPLYKNFYAIRKDELQDGELPIPLEFSVAAFRYGHTLIRARYDWNVNFTGPDAATFEQLFQFTGRNPINPIGGFGAPTLPANWIIDWNRFLGRTSDPDFRFARAIDTALAPPLADMVNEQAGVFRHLARRNLRRGWLLNLPLAQTIASSMASAGFQLSRVLTADEIRSGVIADADVPDAVKDQFVAETPLWFYVLKEAEVINGGRRLGPMGTRIVAETLVGLVVNDSESYWHAGSGGKPWKPADDKPLGAPIDSLEAMLKAAGVL